MPDRPPDTTNLPAVDLLDAVPGLRLADRDWRALVSMRHPVKVALWLALMRPTEELMARESFMETTPPTPDNPNSEIASIPAIVAWAETIVRRGIRGDMAASQVIADRIEGKVGHRKDDVDPDDERRRGDIQTVIEAVVTGMVNARIEGGEEMIDVTPSESVLDTERQDSDSARRNELMEAARRETQDNQARGESLVETNEEPEERDLTDPVRGPRVTNGRGNGHG